MLEAKKDVTRFAKSRFQQVNTLRQELATLEVGSSSLVSFVGKPVMERAFFPGGNGLILGEDADRFPIGGILVLGSNFGALENYCDGSGKLLRLDETNEKGTWVGLRGRFTPEQLHNAFFTNAWPFLHSGPTTKKGSPSNLQMPAKWLRDPSVLLPCLQLFRKTLDKVRPSLIVALGKRPAAFLSYVFPETLLAWRDCSVKAMDKLPYGTASYGKLKIVCVTVSHPSMANSNAARRKEPYQGNAGEARLLSEAFASAERLKPLNGVRNG